MSAISYYHARTKKARGSLQYFSFLCYFFVAKWQTRGDGQARPLLNKNKGLIFQKICVIIKNARVCSNKVNELQIKSGICLQVLLRTQTAAIYESISVRSNIY